MYKLRYKGVLRRGLPEWVFPTYEEIVTVRNGIAVVKKESTVRALLIRGFELIDDSASSPPPPSSAPASKGDEGEKKLESEIIRMFEEDKMTISKIARTLRISRKKVKSVIEAHYAV